MSALDFGGSTGVNGGSSRYYSIASVPQIPDNDWCFGIWTKRNFNAAGVFPTALASQNDPNPAEGYVIYEHGPSNTFQGVAFQNGGTGTTRTFSVPATADGSVYLIIFQRRSTNWELYVVKKGATTSAPDSTDAVTGTTIAVSAPTRIGNSSFGSDGWVNPLGEFFLFTDRSLSASQVTALAAGARPNTANAGGEPLILLPFRSGNVATELNLGTGGSTYNATVVNNSGFTLAPDFFDLLTITSQPGNANAAVGQTAQFSVGATPGVGPLTYQWQDDSSGSFANVSGGSGATTATYTTATTASTFQRRNYRCVVSDANGSINSASAQLTLSWHDVYLYSMPEDADPDDVRLRDPTVFDTGGVTTSSAVSSAASQAASPTALTNAQAAISAAPGQAAASVNATIAQSAVAAAVDQAAASTRMPMAAIGAATSQAAAPTRAPVSAVGAAASQASSGTQNPTGAVAAATDQAAAPTQMPVGAVASAVGQAATPAVDAGGGGTTITSEAIAAAVGQAASATQNPTGAVAAAVDQAASATRNPVGAVAAAVDQASSATQNPTGAVAAAPGQAAAPGVLTVAAAAVAAAPGQAAASANQIIVVASDAVSAAASQAAAPGAGLITIASEAVAAAPGQAAAPGSGIIPPPAGDGKSAWLRTFLQELYQKEFDAQAAIREAAEAARVASLRTKSVPRTSKPIQAEPKPVARTRASPPEPIAPTPVFPVLEPVTVPVSELLSGVTPLPDPLRIPAKIEMPRGIGELNEDDVETLLTLAVAFDL